MKIMLKKGDVLDDAYLKYRDLFDKSDKYDLFISKPMAKNADLSGYKRILISERLDAASLWFRNFLIMDNVAGGVKMFHYHDLEINNRPRVGGRFFVDDPENAALDSYTLTQKDIDKVMPGFSFFHNARFELFFDYVSDIKVAPIRERSIDLMFAGTTIFDPETPSCKWITDKRKLCVDNINKLEGQLNVLAVDGRGLSRTEYYKALRDCKVFLSPFGTGEYCGKDFEALMCGCIVVKPTLPGYCTFNPDYHDDIIYHDNFDNFGYKDFAEIIEQIGHFSRDHIRLKLLDAKKNEIDIVKEILA